MKSKRVMPFPLKKIHKQNSNLKIDLIKIMNEEKKNHNEITAEEYLNRKIEERNYVEEAKLMARNSRKSRAKSSYFKGFLWSF